MSFDAPIERRLGSLADALALEPLEGALQPIRPITANLDLEPGTDEPTFWRDSRWRVRWATVTASCSRVARHSDVDPRDAAEIFIPKAEHRHLDPGRFEASYRARLQQYRRRWTNELEIHVPGEVPHFEHVERTVSRRLRAVGLL